ncbi:type IV pilin protein [Methylomicrobium sp. Wu6]|uniref:type IV pilin protein n=1 Tax=Methylomicrobium sp. Wu6 TaxID=3107928 RepID=UPI002DD673E3|nr:type IV pilin protein [Methylomicrobium sp. Wu6]MEC4747469.1 type IV pilin protein [Methylomicrobium sp. Wu6]
MGSFKRDNGFTFIELMIVIAIIGILAGIAYPSYMEYVKKGRRADAKSALLQVQLAQEKYRTSNTSYGTLVQIGLPANSPDQYYTVAVSNPTTTGYTATATPTGVQTGDKCGNFQINEAGTKSVASAASGYDAAKCW